ncbi:MAG: nucleotide exchange factor GrpE [Desulfitobacteriaceae bacterium]
MKTNKTDDIMEKKSQVYNENQAEANLRDGPISFEDCPNPNLTIEEKVVQLEAELEVAKTQATEYYAHLQRLQADFDNYRKRTQKEKEDISKYAAERLVGAILPVLDNFERAIGSVQTSQDIAGYAQGVEMIFRQMHNVLIKEGLAVIEAVGQPFDPNLHEAILSVESEEHPENTVVEEVQKGYYLKDRVLRPSMVKVSS